MIKQKICIILLVSFLCVPLSACNVAKEKNNPSTSVQDINKESEAVYGKTVSQQEIADAFSSKDIPKYSGEPYVELNNNEPEFLYDSSPIQSYETYNDLDSFGRCGIAEVCIGADLMPTEDRGAIGQVKPSGWHTIKYDNVDGKFLYNRCHLIGYQLTGENANKKNLITGTRYMNTIGMLPFENMIADYIHETNNHVLHRVTPIFEENNLIASGVQMEGESVEDNGEGISYNVFIYNIQPGITIDYATGESYETSDDNSGNENNSSTDVSDTSAETYILNENTQKYHKPECSSVQSIKPQNKNEHIGTDEELIENGYDSCSNCNP